MDRTSWTYSTAQDQEVGAGLRWKEIKESLKKDKDFNSEFQLHT